jgi:indolepyruvate ferredoxin oxidoreductase beta subunit
MRYNLLLVGVGGQGIITLSEIIAMSALSRGIKAIVTQDRGLAQRGGTVKAHIRLGDVYAPMMPKYSAHALLSLEMTETLGFLDYVNKDTILVISTKKIAPKYSTTKRREELMLEHIEELLAPLKKNAFFVDAESKVREMGMPFGTNILMLGMLLGLDERLEAFIREDDIISTMKSRFKRYVEENVKIFNEGIKLGRKTKEIRGQFNLEFKRPFENLKNRLKSE